MSIATDVLTKYFEAQKDLIDIEAVDERSAIISLPIHFSAHTRVELSVTQVTKDQFVISDMAQTIGELKDAGYQVKDTVRERIVGMVKISQLELDGNTLLRQCSAKELGGAIHEFADAAKTIGDVYLAYPTRPRITKLEDELKEKVRRTFQQKQYFYKEREIVPGEVEEHRVDFFIHPNGGSGLAVAVLGDPDRIHAEAWGFKTLDIKNKSKGRVIVGIVYNDLKTQEISRHIIDRMADLSVPASAFDSFADRLDALNISRG
ncbi:MAG: DUF1828 domain-containing protein [Pyrinomonadaceae bacterium]|nr:DUF1828 domain-containing protein [Pyrinomonadaceae bacterium]